MKLGNIYINTHTQLYTLSWKGNRGTRRTDLTDWRLLKSLHLQSGILMRMNEDNKKRKNLSPLSTYCCPALWSSGSGGVGTSGGWAGLKTEGCVESTHGSR